MSKKVSKEKVAKCIVNVAMKYACRTVGRSWPLGAHEIAVPKELSNLEKNCETDK